MRCTMALTAAITLLGSLLLPLLPCALAGTIRVPADVPTIQLAIDAAAPDDLILVAPGVYNENLDFAPGRPAMTVRGEFGADQTIIDGSSVARCVTIRAGILNEITVEGFSIRSGATEALGGGIAVIGGSAVIRDNIISGNHQTAFGGGGGGIHVDATSFQVTIENNLIAFNVASNGCGIHALAPVLIQNNTILGNSSPDATSGGGGILVQGGIVRNNIVVHNHADDGGGAWCEASTSFACNDVWSNTDNNYFGPCDLVSDNFELDPLFCNPVTGDYTLQANSPCLPSNPPTACPLIGAYEQGCGPVAVPSSTWGAVKATYR